MHRTAGDIYSHIIEPTIASDRYMPISPVNLVMPDPDFSLSHIRTLQSEIRLAIDGITKQDFSHIYVDEKGNRFLVKDNRSAAEKDLMPISPLEAQKQALRYLNGMLLICDNLPDKTQKEMMLAKIKEIYTHYKPHLQSERNAIACQWTHGMADAFSMLLKRTQHISEKESCNQLVMARDLSASLEDPFGVITLHKTGPRNEKIMVEVCDPIQITPEYYDRECTSLTKKSWFQCAKHRAGLHKQKDSWLDRFFKVNYEMLRNVGATPGPSARWLPFPATAYRVHTSIIGPGKQISEYFNIRNGIITAYDISDVEEQKRLAKEQLKEILRSHIKAAFNNYVQLYGDMVEKTFDIPARIKFHVNYLTLLSPLPGIDQFNKLVKDNNTVFAKMAKEQLPIALHEIEMELAQDKTIPIALTGFHTNSSINRSARLSEFKQFKSDPDIRKLKLEETSKMIKKLGMKLMRSHPLQANVLLNLADIISEEKEECVLAKPMMEEIARKLENGELNSAEQPMSIQLCTELAMRLRAAFYLRQLLEKKDPFKDMQIFQRNLMQAALELICLGHQSLQMMSCKSSRDRTSIADCTIKVMLADPVAMHDWKHLKEGVRHMLRNGHDYRTFSRYVASLKLNVVHKQFNSLMSDEVKYNSKYINKFATNLKPISKSQYRLKPSRKARFFGSILRPKMKSSPIHNHALINKSKLK